MQIPPPGIESKATVLKKLDNEEVPCYLGAWNAGIEEEICSRFE